MSDTFAIGGRGTMADAAINNGGGYVSGGAAGWTTFQGPNGGALYTVTGASYATVTGIITKNDEFAVGLTDILVHTKEGAAGAWAEAWHAITASDKNSITIASGLGDNTDIDVWVGGAWPATDVGIQAALDLVAAGDTIKVSNAGTHTLAAGLSTNAAVDATAAAPICCEGVNGTTGVVLTKAETYPLVQASGGMTNMFLIQSRHFCTKKLHFDGNAQAIACGIQINEYYSYVESCLVEDVDDDGILMNWLGNQAVDCEVWDVPGDGIEAEDAGQGVLSCSVHDCGVGIRMGGGDYGQTCFGNRVFNNTTDGILWRSFGGVCANNICDHNSRGIYIYSGTSALFANNSCINNTTYGYSFQAANISWAYWGNNHAYGNGTAHCDSCTDENWADFLDGNNISGDPKFVGNYANGDYRLQAGSPLLNAGWPRECGYETDQDAITNYPNIGVFKSVGGRPELRGCNL